MAMSNHRVEVIPVELEPHPNPDIDTLSIVHIWGYTVVVKTADWEHVDRGAYLVPDSVAGNLPIFDFLGEKKRIRVRKFGGEMSQGLLVPAPEGAEIGDDVAEQLGVTRYITDEERKANNEAYGEPFSVPWTITVLPEYDMENWYRYNDELTEGEIVVVTEKIHGSNVRFTYDEETDTMFVGSHHTWKRPELGSLFWACLDNNDWIVNLCKTNPNIMVVGELVGNQGKFSYGVLNKQRPDFKIFDMWDKVNHKFISYPDMTCNYGLDVDRFVPCFYHGPYSEDAVKKHADGQTWVNGAKHIREGCVVAREDSSLKLKIVSDNYYLKS